MFKKLRALKAKKAMRAEVATLQQERAQAIANLKNITKSCNL